MEKKKERVGRPRGKVLKNVLCTDAYSGEKGDG